METAILTVVLIICRTIIIWKIRSKQGYILKDLSILYLIKTHTRTHTAKPEEKKQHSKLGSLPQLKVENKKTLLHRFYRPLGKVLKTHLNPTR